MWTNQITKEDVSKRGRVHDMAPSDPEGALKVARSIPHAWYRCQALTSVAEHTSAIPKKLMLLDEALAAAQMQEEINRKVTVSSWPMRVLAPLDAPEAKRRLSTLVAQANEEPHSLRRADALFSLAAAVHKFEVLERVVAPSLVSALLAGRGWRIDRLIRATLQLGIAPSSAEQLLAHHRDGREKRRFLELQNGQKI